MNRAREKIKIRKKKENCAIITKKILRLYYLLLHKVNTRHSNLLIVPFNNYCRHIDEKGFFFLLLIINYHRLTRKNEKSVIKNCIICFFSLLYTLLYFLVFRFGYI